MQVDRDLVRKAQLASNGANIHDVSQMIQTYISSIEASKVVPNDLAVQFISTAEQYRRKLEVFVQNAKSKRAA